MFRLVATQTSHAFPVAGQDMERRWRTPSYKSNPASRSRVAAPADFLALRVTHHCHILPPGVSRLLARTHLYLAWVLNTRPIASL